MDSRIILLDHHDNPRDDLATRYLAELGLNTQLVCPFEGDSMPQMDDSISGVVIYGGAQNVTELDKFPFLREEMDWIDGALKEEVPMLGICLGAQLMAHQLGAKVDFHPDGHCEFGYYEIHPTESAEGFMTSPMRVTQAHFQHFDLPSDTTLLATGDKFPNQAFRHGSNAYGIQFHPEVSVEIFNRWQDAEWSDEFYQTTGSQTREEQDEHKHQAGPVQAQWFRDFLENLFIRTAGQQA